MNSRDLSEIHNPYVTSEHSIQFAFEYRIAFVSSREIQSSTTSVRYWPPCDTIQINNADRYPMIVSLRVVQHQVTCSEVTKNCSQHLHISFVFSNEPFQIFERVRFRFFAVKNRQQFLRSWHNFLELILDINRKFV